MATPSIEDRLRRIFTEQLGDVPELAANTPLDAMMADSLDQVEVIMGVEDEFRIEIEEADLEVLAGKDKTFGDALELLERLIK